MLESGDGAVVSTKTPNADLSAASLKSLADAQIGAPGAATQNDRSGINVAAVGGSDYPMLLGNSGAPQNVAAGMNVTAGGGSDYSTLMRDLSALQTNDRTGMNVTAGGGSDYSTLLRDLDALRPHDFSGAQVKAGGGNDYPVLRGNPQAIPPEYPGGKGPDLDDTRRAVGALGPEARMMFELFERTYNSRAGENYLPSQLQLKEVDPSRKADIVKWELMGDSQIYQPKSGLGGRDLKPVADNNPGSSKNPGHMYAIGYNKDGLPSDVLEYYRDTTANNIVYRKQYQLDYIKMPSGNPIGYEIDVKELFAPGQTRNYGMHKNIAGIDHTLGGITKWYEAPNSKFLGVEQFSGWQMDKARLQMNFNGAAVETSTIKQDGTYNRQSFIGPSADRVVSQLAQNFYFFDLFGPPKQ